MACADIRQSVNKRGERMVHREESDRNCRSVGKIDDMLLWSSTALASGPMVQRPGNPSELRAYDLDPCPYRCP